MEDKMYLIFVGEDYYPNGGMDDFKTSKSTPSEVVEYIQGQLNSTTPDYFIDIVFCDGESIEWVCFIFKRERTVWVNRDHNKPDWFTREEQPFDEWADYWLKETQSS